MMFRYTTFALLLATACADVPSLTPDNYDEMTAGKTVFIKFFAPWVRRTTVMVSIVCVL